MYKTIFDECGQESEIELVSAFSMQSRVCINAYTHENLKCKQMNLGRADTKEKKKLDVLKIVHIEAILKVLSTSGFFPAYS